MTPQSRASGCLPSGKVNPPALPHDIWLVLDLRLTEPFWFSSDFRRRFLSLLSYQFSSFHPSLALSILQNKKSKEETRSKIQLLPNIITFPQDLPRSDLTCVWPPQLSVAPSWLLTSALTTSNVWSCIRGAWWTTTLSWTWSQPWHACSSSMNLVTSPSQQRSV